jgi:hypothetical protein
VYSPSRLGEGHAGRLVDRDVSRRHALQTFNAHQRRDLKAVERIACTEQRSRDDGAHRTSAGGHHADGSELTSPGESQQRKKTGLQHRKASRNAGRPEGHSVGTYGERHAERVTNSLAALARHSTDSCRA